MRKVPRNTVIVVRGRCLPCLPHFPRGGPPPSSTVKLHDSLKLQFPQIGKIGTLMMQGYKGASCGSVVSGRYLRLNQWELS